MKQYLYILLDWDGNLAKTLDIWLEACRETLVKRGLHVSDEQIAASFGAFIPHMVKWGVTDPEVAMEEADKIAKQTLPYVELYPDALVVLEDLYKRGKRMALITSSTHENVEHLLVKHNLLHFFNAVVAGDDVTHHKPHTEPLDEALALIDGTKDSAVIIGDSDKDIGAAHNAGIDSILFYPEEHKKFYKLNELRSMQPTHIVHDFREVLKLI